MESLNKIEQLSVVISESIVARGQALSITVIPNPRPAQAELRLYVRVVSASGECVFCRAVTAVNIDEDRYELRLRFSDEYDQEVHFVYLSQPGGETLAMLQVMVVDADVLERMDLFNSGLDKRREASERLDRGQIRLATEALRQAGELYLNAKYFRPAAEVHLDLAEIHQDTRQFEDAADEARKGLALYRVLEDWRGVDAAHELLHGIAQKQKKIVVASPAQRPSSVPSLQSGMGSLPALLLACHGQLGESHLFAFACSLDPGILARASGSLDIGLWHSSSAYPLPRALEVPKHLLSSEHGLVSRARPYQNADEMQFFATEVASRFADHWRGDKIWNQRHPVGLIPLVNAGIPTSAFERNTTSRLRKK